MRPQSVSLHAGFDASPGRRVTDEFLGHTWRPASVEVIVSVRVSTSEESTRLDPLAAQVEAARGGDSRALERVVEAVQPVVLRLALRMFGSPEDARDATQEALVHMITRLDRFEGRSAFSTWVYRVATNKFLSMRRSRSEREAVGFEEFERILDRLDPADAELPLDAALLLEEVKVGCTLAMLQCLDRDHRLAYILGAILELDHQVASEVLGVAAPTYRKRLSRARERITGLMQAKCGLVQPRNPCRCARRLSGAMAHGCVVASDLRYATSAARAERFPEVLAEIRRLDEAKRSAALFRSHPDLVPDADLTQMVRRTLALDSPGTN